MQPEESSPVCGTILSDSQCPISSGFYSMRFSGFSKKEKTVSLGIERI
jgi:hypothetical protein